MCDLNREDARAAKKSTMLSATPSKPVMLLPQSGRHQEAPSKGAEKLFGFDLLPFGTRRASQKRAKKDL